MTSSDSNWRSWLQNAWPMVVPLLLSALAVYFLREPIASWREGDRRYDEQVMKEWLREARIGSSNLPELVKDLLRISADLKTSTHAENGITQRLLNDHQQKRDEIKEMLQSLCRPPTKIYPGQLPLFPVIYRVEIRFDDDLKESFDDRLNFTPLVWDSENPRHRNQSSDMEAYEFIRDQGVKIHMQYQLHVLNQKQHQERDSDAKRRLINIWVLFFACAALVWMLIMQSRADRRENQRQQTELEIQESKQKHLEEELRRQEAERKQEVAERKHLEEELRRQQAEREKQEAERQALELKSQMFHNIGVMAKSYAHNIKNLLVRPNDLLRRCLENHSTSPDEQRMLHEIQQTLGTVTERLQEILQTVQRDPNKFERKRIDLHLLVKDLHATWAEQAESKWKMIVEIDLHGAEGLFIDGDRSHLQQTLENFLFNARDAISEMRNYLRKQARPDGAAAHGPLAETQRQALIAAAGWKGRVLIRTAIVAGQPVIEVHDNGIGMTPETRDHCTEPHYSTKRNNALYAGLSAGMGLGLSFVQMILEHHGAALEIESAPLQGALFRLRFPASKAPAGPASAV